MFDDGVMAVSLADITTLSRLAESVLPVPEPFVDLLPSGGLVRGAMLATAGPVAQSLAMALVGPLTQMGSWCAVVGLEELGLLAASELGVELGRVLVVDEADPTRWPATVDALLDAVEVVLVRVPSQLSAATASRLVARARGRGSVLMQVGSSGSLWPQSPDFTISARSLAWDGIGFGHGHLRARHVEVEVVGRRVGGPARHGSIWLPGPDGAISRR